MEAKFVDDWLDPFVNKILVVPNPRQNLREIPTKTIQIAPKKITYHLTILAYLSD